MAVSLTRGPDLSRCSGDGFTVTARYVPDLAAPVLAVVSVHSGARCIGALTIPACDGMSVYRHPAIYLPAYREAMGVSGDA